jgi:hypothetical protein
MTALTISAATRWRMREKGRELMPTPAPSHPNEPGKRWLLAKTQQILADNAVTLAAPRSENDPSCFWGTEPETGTILYVRLEGDPEPKALPFRRDLIAGCGSGLYMTQDRAILLIRRTLKKMGILPI